MSEAVGESRLGDYGCWQDEAEVSETERKETSEEVVEG
jgi:hypothetical protein